VKGLAASIVSAVGAFVGFLALETDARAGLFGDGGGSNPIEDVKNDMEEKKTAEQLELEKRLQAIEDATKGKNARVVVLQWRDTDTTYQNETLQRNIKARIARADAKFYPEVDLYQAGRAEPDKTVAPANQRARVSDDAIARVLSAVEDVQSIQWGAITEQDWGLKANDLKQLADEVWFVDRPELREPLFLLYSQIGLAAENSNSGSPPYYENVDNKTVNYYWYLAGVLAYKDPSLLAKITDQSLYGSIAYYKDLLDSGSFQFLRLNFEIDNEQFDPKAFATDYIIYVNGIEESISNTNGILDVPLGREDVYLKRTDGHSLSERLDIQTLTDRFFFVRQNAKKVMGLDFQEQLMDHPSECIPDIDGTIKAYLSIYAKMHPQSEVYIAVPKAGSTAPGHIFLWRWDRQKAELVLVRDNTGGFPVRFAALMGGGLNFSGVQVTVPSAEESEEAAGNLAPNATGGDIGALGSTVLPNATPNLDGVPIKYTLRGHFNHFMGAVGIQYKIGIAGNTQNAGTGQSALGIDNPDKAYFDYYPAAAGTGEGDGDRLLFEQTACGTGTPSTSTGLTPTTQTGTFPEGETPPPGPTPGCYTIAYRERNLQRLVFLQAGFMLGRDASSGWGLRGFFQTGWYNVPHAMDWTLHAGYTGKVGKDKPGKRDEEDRMGRVRFILDADFYGGFWTGIHNSRYRGGTVNLLNSRIGVGKPYATFGFDASAGFTF
jgi:hypothetical protein